MADFSFKNCAYAFDDMMISAGYTFKFSEIQFEQQFLPLFITLCEQNYEVDQEAAEADADYMPPLSDEEEESEPMSEASESVTLEESDDNDDV